MRSISVAIIATPLRLSDLLPHIITRQVYSYIMSHLIITLHLISQQLILWCQSFSHHTMSFLILSHLISSYRISRHFVPLHTPGHRIQFLVYDPTLRRVNVTRLLAKHGSYRAGTGNELTYNYTYEVWVPQVSDVCAILSHLHGVACRGLLIEIGRNE